MSWIPQGGDVSRDQEVSQDWMNAMVSSKEWFILTIEDFWPTDGADQDRSSGLVIHLTFTLATPHEMRSWLANG
jgi:hypothetical protein